MKNIFYCKKFAFTLAEVLITLGIIGVVAALTLPTLIANYQEKALETQYKKAKTVIANGYKMMMAKEETYEVSNLSFMQDGTKLSKDHRVTFNILKDGTNDEMTNLPESYSIEGESLKSPFRWSDVPYLFVTTDGMLYGVKPSEDKTSFDVFADVNGNKNPNKVKKDLYKFKYTGSGKLSDVSDDLAKVNECTVDNPSGCTTEEACRALPDGPDVDYEYCIYWTYDGRCEKTRCAE